MHRSLMLLVGVLGAVIATTAPAEDGDQLALARQKLKHVVVIFQEHRSFDPYLVSIPGAEGFPGDASSVIAASFPLDPAHSAQGCVKHFHDRELANTGGPHGPPASEYGIDRGRMDGF